MIENVTNGVNEAIENDEILKVIVIYNVLIVTILDFFNPAQEINTTRNVWLKILEGSKCCKCLALGWGIVFNFSCQYRWAGECSCS